MPYANKNLSMLILLPKRRNGIGDIEKELTVNKLAGWLAPMSESRVIYLYPEIQDNQPVKLIQCAQRNGNARCLFEQRGFLRYDWQSTTYSYQL